MRSSLSTIRRRVETLARQNVCELPHILRRFGWQDEGAQGPTWQTDAPGVCVCGEPISYEDVVIRWLDSESCSTSPGL